MKEVLSIYKENTLDKSYDSYYVGKNKNTPLEVVRIEYREPRGEGDAHYVDVYIKDNTVLRIFRPDSVEFKFKLV